MIYCVGIPLFVKVISVEKLGTDYKSFEAKRKLSASYDVFLCDKRIYGRLSTLLGKKFFEKKKYGYVALYIPPVVRLGLCQISICG